MKEIKLKLSDLLLINDALEKILNNRSSGGMDTLFQFKILGILKELERHVSSYNQIRNEKIKEYGKPGENGEIAIPPEDDQAIRKFHDDLIPILNSEISVALEPLEPENVFSMNLDAKMLLALYPLMESKS